MSIPIAFVDVETTHLDASIGHAWEVAVILREFEDGQHTDTEYVWQIRPNLAHADPEALKVGRFEERFAVPDGVEAAWTLDEDGLVAPMTRAEAITAIVNVLRGAVLVGSNPAFDDRHLRRLVGRGRAQWHYRPYDIVQLAAAKIGPAQAGSLPWSSYALSLAIGVQPPSSQVAHTALGDARWARDVHDAAMVREQIPLSWEGRANHAIGLYTATACELDDAKRERNRLRQVLSLLRSALANAQSAAHVVKLARQAEAAVAQPGDADTLWPSAVLSALDGPSEPVMTGQTEAVLRTERSHWVDIAAALNAAVDAGLPVGIDLDGTLTDHNAWSVIWDPSSKQWEVAGYDDDLDEVEDEDLDEDGAETGDADGDVFELISEIASRLSDATDDGEYHAVNLISDLANGRKTIAEARAELAEITFRHV